ncbi:rap guanine nucleotide exchange factor-like 1 [Gouania willdenowi]|uniref:rap guanine nucleotide exchange factor-like 1 n=1 Tax=Gouania willdenowi TaxID=441366 RepID=UPI0010549B94|nr:rap guanine nucleotide exchange factor-like 1 [Gouania willdenowi]
MPSGMKPLEKFLKKQSSGLNRTGTANRRRASLSRVVPFFREPSPEEGKAREVLSPDSEDVSPWPAAPCEAGSSCAEVSSPTNEEQGLSESQSETPDQLIIALIHTLAGQRCDIISPSTEMLLDDFMLTHLIYLPGDRLQQVLTQQFSLDDDIKQHVVGGAKSAADRKWAVLQITFRYLENYRELLQEQTYNNFPKDLCVCALQDLSAHPELVEDVLKLQRWTEILNCPSEEVKDSRRKQVRPLFRHFRRIDACLQPREAFRGSDEIFCRVYSPDHSYVTIRSRLSCSVEEILCLVREKLQFSEDQPVLPVNLILVAVTSSGEKAVFRPSDEAVFTTLGVNTHLFVCDTTELDTLTPLPEEVHWSPGDSKLHDMSAEEVTNQLVVFDWELFSCVHEVEFVCYVFHGEQAQWRPLNLELVLQRCSELQHWVATEILQCSSLPKRVQLVRKFIKIASLCKQQQDLLSFLAVVLGLDNPAVSRLRLTWEGLPGRFRKQFQQFESVVDPSRNHKSYRDLLSTLRPPLIPFTPLLLKDLTFLHESCKTFHGDVVNFEKMHKVAEMVRTIRWFRHTQPVMDTETSPSHLQTKAYIRQLQVIDNQNLLFDLSCKLEPKDT